MAPPPAANVIINEVDADQTSRPTRAEFIELYDGGTGNTDLTGLIAWSCYNGSDDASYLAFDLRWAESTDGDGYFVLVWKCG